MPKKILFRGLGGAGQRHLRIIKEILPDARLLYCSGVKNTPLLNSDFSINESASLVDHYQLEFYDHIDLAYEQTPDLVIIAVPSSLLADETLRALNFGSDVLCEKPGAINIKEAEVLLKTMKTTSKNLFFSYQREFHPALIKLRALFKDNFVGKIENIRIRVSSYVPSWHPYEDFRSLYACRKELGGGVLLTEIHELFYLMGILGLPKSVHFTAKNDYKGLIDVEHHISGIMEYDNYLCSIDLSFMQKKPERYIEILGSEGHVLLDLNMGILKCSKHGDKESSEIYSPSNDQLFREQFIYYKKSDFSQNITHINTFLSTMVLVENIRESFETKTTIEINESILKSNYF